MHFADGKYLWTRHAHDKMRYYRLTEARVKRIIRHPARVEEGVLEKGIAAMQPAGGKRYSEVWVMYIISDQRFQKHSARLKEREVSLFAKKVEKGIKIITAWRYPGKSPERDPVPLEILREIKRLL